MKTVVLSVLIAIFTFFPAVHAAEAPAVEAGKQVTINYQLSVDGKVIDSSETSGPIEYQQGDETVLPPKLQQGIEGLKVGEKTHVTLMPEDGYGPINPDAVIEVPKTSLPEGDVQVGTVLSTVTEDGQPLTAVVVELRDQTAMLDFNHPLAGKQLEFDIEVTGVQ